MTRYEIEMTRELDSLRWEIAILRTAIWQMAEGKNISLSAYVGVWWHVRVDQSGVWLTQGGYSPAQMAGGNSAQNAIMRYGK